jgi:hypothetical protein
MAISCFHAASCCRRSSSFSGISHVYGICLVMPFLLETRTAFALLLSMRGGMGIGIGMGGVGVSRMKGTNVLRDWVLLGGALCQLLL